MEFREIIEKRRAVKFFDPNKDLPEDLIRKLVEMATKAPSNLNSQP